MKRRAVFLDLNGTLVMPILVKHPRELTLIDGAATAVANLSAAGFVCPVVTIQSRIEKGRFANPCHCKKPSTFLYAQAAVDHEIDLHRSFVVGDSAADVEAASRFGGQGCLVRTGWGANEREVQRAMPYASHLAQSITDAAAWILQKP